MGFTSFYLTNKGAALLAKAESGTTLTFTKGAIGKGVLESGVNLAAITALSDKVKDVPLAGIAVSGQQATFKLQIINNDIQTAFQWTEIGLFANDPDEGEILYAYGYAGSSADTMPSKSEAAVEFVFNMIGRITNAVQVEVDITQGQIYATKDDIAANAYKGTVAPTNPVQGMWWYNDTTGELKIYMDSSWISAKNIIIHQSSKPSGSYEEGTLWHNTDSDNMYIYLAEKGDFLPFFNVSESKTYTDGRIAAHNTAGDAHENLFAQKSPLNHVHDDRYYTEAEVDEKLNTKAKKIVYTATLSTNWLGSTAPYTQTVSISGILASDTPHIAPVYGSNIEDEIQAWSLITRAATGNDSITFYCYGDKPTIQLNLQIEVIR